ncbi:MAG: DUF429 domain-containing protein [Candidatus Micrarchaeia archaeon]
MFAGIDLAAKEKNPSGACLLSGRRARCATLHSDGEIIAWAAAAKPALIAVDAPLSLPRKGSMRRIERELAARGLRVLPLRGAMRALARRGMRLKKRLAGLKMHVIEVHPRSSLSAIRRAGRRVRFPAACRNEHERDAWLAALTAKLFAEGGCELIGGAFALPSA